MTEERKLNWDFAEPVNVWRAVDSSPNYELIAKEVLNKTYQDMECFSDEVEIITYKITRSDDFDASTNGAYITYITLNNTTELEKDRYRYMAKQLDAVCGGLE